MVYWPFKHWLSESVPTEHQLDPNLHLLPMCIRTPGSLQRPTRHWPIDVCTSCALGFPIAWNASRSTHTQQEKTGKIRGICRTTIITIKRFQPLVTMSHVITSWNIIVSPCLHSRIVTGNLAHPLGRGWTRKNTWAMCKCRRRIGPGYIIWWRMLRLPKLFSMASGEWSRSFLSLYRDYMYMHMHTLKK